MAWQLNGQLIENCSCNMFCPCWFGVQELMIMDQGWCAGSLALRIEEGSSDGVDLSGRTVVLRVHFPGPTMFDGNAHGRVHVDEGASDEQRTELETIAQGKKGGPMEQLAPLITTWLPTQTATIGVQEDGETITVGVDGAGEVRSQVVRDPEGNGFTMRGGGFIMGFGLQEAELAGSEGAKWVDSELPQESVEMKSGARGAFTWSG
jgi:hypothetical protein